MAGVDLVEFLTARLDEDERTAAAARGRLWRHDGAGGPHSIGPAYATVTFEPSAFSHEQGQHVCGSALVSDAAHIARHDPARVLAEVAAKRRIVEDARQVPTISMRHVLRLLALPYAEHPEYSADWAPHSM